MRILFPAHPLDARKPDKDFAPEVAAAKKAGFETALLSDDFQIRPSSETSLYRGWMLRPEQYAQLAQITPLITNPVAYQTTHLLPNWFPLLQNHTPASLWFPENGRLKTQEDPLGLNDVVDAAHAFDGRPIIVKDYVKSRKHEWTDACFIRDSLDDVEIRRVVGNFLERQGTDLVGDLVLREFVPLKKLGVHAKSKMPLSNEWRLFFWQGRLLVASTYWSDEDTTEPTGTQREVFEVNMSWVENIQSPFFTVDVAQKEDGSWIIIELGDGGVSGLQGIDPELFYQTLATAQ